ncbi:pyrophosphate--fructose 6-phosphate 1-phosphotransferase [Fulvitalea axinellae]|uniref:Pyrophosphate--fructose 6-phosphate 1-phosphotransferase n=2 Tax=Fulvitalea axinellae TaxID=1182444 RepID=A0AAU9CAW2_9BACT|nr:pyrophosphate--fructose 6-phosphate 1-phosphotransferase [Fulvitalea axinellae]
MKRSVAILCGGGPAPGINTVISTITKFFVQQDYRVLGVQYGYKTIFTENPEFIELDFKFADLILNRGGSALPMSRYKPEDSEFDSRFFIDNNVELLVTIGGDDTASTANRISKYLLNNGLDVANIHVPKTIDNDLPLPEGIPTFGYQTALHEGVQIALTAYEDARTSHNWFVLSAMGREAGHLALGIGKAAHFPMIIVPEMFENSPVTLDKITRLVVSSMLKRTLLGINYGAAIVSEGVFHFLKDEEIANSGINFTYDDHGHPELFSVSKAHIFKTLVQKECDRIGLNINSRPVELGFELRCTHPIGYDLTMCTLLGLGVGELFKQGRTGCMVSVDIQGNIRPLYLRDVADKDGKVQPRLVNIQSEMVRNVFKHNMQYITEKDYEYAKELVPNPEHYDFKKILAE